MGIHPYACDEAGNHNGGSTYILVIYLLSKPDARSENYQAQANLVKPTQWAANFCLPYQWYKQKPAESYSTIRAWA